MQSLWKKQLDWDDELDTAEQIEWSDIKSDLEGIGQVEIIRCIRKECENKYDLMCFCDASAVAYACAVYLIQCDGTRSSHLVFSEARLAPVKTMTIPRLELMAVLIGTRSLQCVREQLKLHFENTCDSDRLTVCSRVDIIRENTADIHKEQSARNQFTRQHRISVCEYKRKPSRSS